jgi:septum site-determining protein MinC
MDIVRMGENLTKTQAFKLKGRLYTFTVLQVCSVDENEFKRHCAETVAKAPKLLERAPIVFDLALVSHLDFDLRSLCQIVSEYGMIPVAIQGGTPVQDTLAQCNGLAVLHASTAQDKPLVAPSVASAVVNTKLITTPVRSGQQIVSKAGDLIITSSVSHGAELLSDGNIHVYGALRGRALAGLSGDTKVRIFCQSLDAELLSIAGFYRLSDSIEPLDRPCQIYLLDEHLVIEPL